ncbi:winged helix-turn-helix domain-containing protein [Aquifex sp.]
MKLKYKFWFEKDGEAVLTDLKYRILKEIKRKGSIKESAKSLGISYKKALEHIKVMERRLGFRVVKRERGKGARLTPEAEHLLKRYERAKEAFEKPVRSLDEE